MRNEAIPFLSCVSFPILGTHSTVGCDFSSTKSSFFAFPLPCLEIRFRMYLIYKATHESMKIRISGGHYSGSDMN